MRSGGNSSLRNTKAVLTIILFSLTWVACATDQVANKEKARAMERLGNSLVREGNLREGLQQLLRAAELDPDDPDLQHEVALVYRNLREYQHSLLHFEKVLEIEPDFPQANAIRNEIEALKKDVPLA